MPIDPLEQAKKLAKTMSTTSTPDVLQPLPSEQLAQQTGERASATPISISKVKAHFATIRNNAMKFAGKKGHNPFVWLRDNIVAWENKIRSIEFKTGESPLYEDEVDQCLAITTEPDTKIKESVIVDKFATKKIE